MASQFLQDQIKKRKESLAAQGGIRNPLLQQSAEAERAKAALAKGVDTSTPITLPYDDGATVRGARDAGVRSSYAQRTVAGTDRELTRKSAVVAEGADVLRGMTERLDAMRYKAQSGDTATQDVYNASVDPYNAYAQRVQSKSAEVDDLWGRTSTMYADEASSKPAGYYTDEYTKHLNDQISNLEAESRALRALYNDEPSALHTGRLKVVDERVAAAKAERDTQKSDLYRYKQAQKTSRLAAEARKLNASEVDWSRRKWGASLSSGEKLVRYLTDVGYRAKRDVAALRGGMSAQFANTEYLNEQEKKTILAFAGAGRFDQAEEYYKTLEPHLNQRSFARTAETVETLPGVLGKTTRAVMPVATNLAAPIAYGEALAGGVRNAITGEYKPVDINTGVSSMIRAGQLAQAKTVTDLANHVYETTGSQLAYDVTGFLTPLGYSILNNVINTMWGPGLSLAMMSVQAAGQETVSQLGAGTSVNKALATGTLSGLIEAITEKIPLDNFFRIAKEGVTGSTVKALLKQAGIEATEELVGEYMNVLQNRAILGEQSEYDLYVASLIGQGLSEADATKEANIKFFVVNPLLSGLGGAISGGVMGGTAVAVNQRAMTQYGKAVIDAGQQERVVAEIYLKSEPDSLSRQYAETLKTKLDKGEAVTAAEIGKVSAQYQADTRAEAEKKSPNPQTAQFAQTKSANPDATVLNPAASELKRISGMDTDTAQEQGRLITDLASGEKVNVDNIDVENPAVQKVFSEKTGAEITDADKKEPKKLKKVFINAAEYAELQKKREARMRAEATAAKDKITMELQRRAQEQKGAATEELQTALGQAGAGTADQGVLFSDGSTLNREQFFAQQRAFDAKTGTTRTDAELAALYTYAQEYNRAQGPVPGNTSTDIRSSLGGPGETRTGATEAQKLETGWVAKQAEKVLSAFGISGVSVEYDGFAGNENAVYDPATRQIVLNGNRLTGRNTVLWALGHELTHTGEDGAPNLTGEIIDGFQRLEQHGTLPAQLSEQVRGLDALIERKRSTYARHLFTAETQGLTPLQIGARRADIQKRIDAKLSADDSAYIRQEIAADWMGEVFQSQKLLNRLAGERPGILERAQEALDTMRAKLSGQKGREYLESRKVLDELSSKLETALRAAADQAEQDFQNQRYSLEEDIEMVLNGTDNDDYNAVYLGEMPPLYSHFGVELQPVTITKAHLRAINASENRGGHDIPVNVLQRLPTLLAEPLIVYDAYKPRQNTSIVVVTRATIQRDGKNVPVIIPLRMNGSAHVDWQGITSTHVTSVYAPHDFNLFANWSAYNNVMLGYSDDAKRSPVLASYRGVLFPTASAKAGSMNLVAKSKNAVNAKNDPDTRFLDDRGSPEDAIRSPVLSANLGGISPFGAEKMDSINNITQGREAVNAQNNPDRRFSLDSDGSAGYNEVEPIKEGQSYGVDRTGETQDREYNQVGIGAPGRGVQRGTGSRISDSRDAPKGILGQRYRGKPLLLVSEQTRATMNRRLLPDLSLQPTTDYEGFSSALNAAKRENLNGAMVDTKDAQDMAEGEITLYLSRSRLAGVGVESDGNITAVFKNSKDPTRIAIHDLLITAISNGGTKLDCYVTDDVNNLGLKYAQLGFEPVAWLPFNREYAAEDWDYDRFGEPDVVFWVHNGDSPETVAERAGLYAYYTQDEIHALPEFTDYMEAWEYRDNILAERQAAQSQADSGAAFTSGEVQAPSSDIRAFNRWFKDGGGELRNEDGTPKILYHGTTRAGFTQFDIANDFGYFLSDDPTTSLAYAGTREEFVPFVATSWEDAQEKVAENFESLSLELNSEDGDDMYELVTDTGEVVGSYWADNKGLQDFNANYGEVALSSFEAGVENPGMYQFYASIENPLIVEGRGQGWRDIDGKSTREWVAEAFDGGYDGVIFHDIRDGGRPGRENTNVSNVYVVRDPGQVKSVHDIGTWNRRNPDIRYSLAESPEYAAFMAQFNEQFGAGTAEDAIRTVQQLQRAKERAERRAAAAEHKLDLSKWKAKIEKMNAVEQQRSRGEDALGRQRVVFHTKAEVARRKANMEIALIKADAWAEKWKAVQRERTRGEEKLARHEARLKEDARQRLNRSKRAEDYRAAEADLANRMHEGKKVAQQRARVEQARREGQERVTEARKLNRRTAKEAKSILRLHRKTAAPTPDNAAINTIRKLPEKVRTWDKVKNAAKELRVKGRDAYKMFVNAVQEIDRFSGLQTDGMRAGTLVNIVGGTRSTIETVFKEGLVNRGGETIGASLQDTVLVWDGVGRHRKIDMERQALLQDYMLHKHNINRMSFRETARKAVEDYEAQHPWLTTVENREFALMVANNDPVAERYSELMQRAKDARDKPVFADANGKPVTAETSRAVVAQYESEHPWVVNKAQEIYDWWDTFMQEWAIGTSISQLQYDVMKEIYPFYVPTYRVEKGGVGGAAFVGRGSASTGQAVKRAIGGTSEVRFIEDSYADLVSKIVRLNRTNELYRNIIDTAMLDEGGVFEDYAIFDWEGARESLGVFMAMRGEMQDVEKESTKTSLEKLDDGAFRVNAWIDGERISAFISEEMYNALMSVSGTKTGSVGERVFDAAVRTGNALTGPMKTMITGINLFFATRNVSRDFPTAVINSISGLAFPKYWAKAAIEIKNNSDHWKRFRALGGTHAGYYNNESGFAQSIARGKNVLSRGVEKLGAFNDVTEAQTRFAEYLATIDRLPGGDTYENRLQGIKNAAEVTVDFSRKGTAGKLINAWVPYWNPAVQGIDKVIRSAVGTEKTAKAIAKNAAITTGRAALTTIVFEALLQVLYAALGRREDWEQLSDRMKDTYYCIPWFENHTFIKVPKNREWGAILGTPFSRILQGIGGRADPFENYIETSLIPNFLPPLPMDIIGISQVTDLKANEDFAGRAIIPYAYQDASPSEQYNSDTTMLAMGISRALDATGVSDIVAMISEGITLSPMQVDYIIHDYCGDFVSMWLELFPQGLADGSTTPEEITNSLVEATTKPFFADNRYSNAQVSRYYDMLDSLDSAVTDMRVRGMTDEEVQNSTEYKIRSALNSDLGKLITALNAEVRTAPDGKEKDAAKGEIAQLAMTALDFYDRAMSGEIKEPKLYQTYSGFSATVRDELTRLDTYSSEYGFKPSSYKPAAITHPEGSKREFVLTDAQQEQYATLYDENYDAVMSDVMARTRYRKAKDEKKAEILEAARDDVLAATKKDMIRWLKSDGVKTTKKK